MKKFGFIIFAGALIVGLVVTNLFSFGRVTDKFFNFSFNFKGVKGSGNMGTEKRELSDFHSVDVSGVFEVEITAQKEFGVEVEADDNLLPLIETKVRNGVLHIETERKVKTDNPLRIRISVPNIEKIDSSGASTVNLTGLSNEGLEVDSSGASKVKVSGATARLNIDVSGATRVDADGLTAGNATVEASGASHVNVNVTGNLKTNASGASKIVYAGSPKDVVKKASGASSVSPK